MRKYVATALHTGASVNVSKWSLDIFFFCPGVLVKKMLILESEVT